MLNLILLTSLFSLGLFVSGQSGYILFPIRNAIAKLLGGVYVSEDNEWYYRFTGFMNHVWKPFWGCPTCMSSVWGIVVYLLFSKVTHETIYELPVLIISAAGLNFIIFNNLIKKWLND